MQPHHPSDVGANPCSPVSEVPRFWFGMGRIYEKGIGLSRKIDNRFIF